MSEHEFHFEEEKASELIAYIASRVDIGKTKLMKLLYLIDFTAYEELGRPVSGDEYEHWPLGPVPKKVYNTLQAPAKSFPFETREETRGDNAYMKFVPKGEIHTTRLTQDEISVIDSVLEKYGQLSSHELVALTHKELPYRLTSSQQKIPYVYAVFRSYHRATATDVERLTKNEAYMNRIDQAFAPRMSRQRSEVI